MVLLGDRFPGDYKIKKLNPGSVIYTHCHFTIPAKNKYHLVCCCDPLLVLLINSNIPQFIERNPSLNNWQVISTKKDHPFLNWDLFVDCIDAHAAYDVSFFRKQLRLNFDNFYRGDISVDCVIDIIRAVNISPRMISKYKKMITKELNALLLKCKVLIQLFNN